MTQPLLTKDFTRVSTLNTMFSYTIFGNYYHNPGPDINVWLLESLATMYSYTKFGHYYHNPGPDINVWLLRNSIIISVWQFMDLFLF